MKYNKFHESDSLAAISRELKAKKKATQEHTTTDGSDHYGINSTANARKDKRRLNQAQLEENFDGADQSSSEGEETASRGLVKQKGKDRHGDEVPAEDKDRAKRSKKEKKRKKLKGEHGIAEPGNGDFTRPSGNGKTTPASENESTGGLGDGAVTGLFKLLLSKEEKPLAGLGEVLKPILAEGPDGLEEAAAEAGGECGAKAASLLLRLHNTAAGIIAETAVERRPRPIFFTPEEGLFTPGAGAGRTEMQAPRLWRAVAQFGAEATVAARAALLSSHGAEARDSSPEPLRGEQLRKHFGEFYRASFVDSFSDDLEAMRTAADGAPARPEVILKCIQAGIDMFSDVEQNLFLSAAAEEHSYSDAQAHSISDLVYGT